MGFARDLGGAPAKRRYEERYVGECRTTTSVNFKDHGVVNLQDIIGYLANGKTIVVRIGNANYEWKNALKTFSKILKLVKHRRSASKVSDKALYNISEGFSYWNPREMSLSQKRIYETLADDSDAYFQAIEDAEKKQDNGIDTQPLPPAD